MHRRTVLAGALSGLAVPLAPALAAPRREVVHLELSVDARSEIIRRLSVLEKQLDDYVEMQRMFTDAASNRVLDRIDFHDAVLGYEDGAGI